MKRNGAKSFSDWLPKMSSCGVVLFHEINVREREFGVWRFWEEIATRYQTLAFVHSHGLGLAYVGSEPPPVSLRTLLALSDPDSLNRIRSYFARLGMSLIDQLARREAEGIAGRVRATEAELEAARAEIRWRVETADALRIEAGRATVEVSLLQGELAKNKAEVARLIEAAAALQQQCSEAKSELARQRDASSISQVEAQKATDRIALLDDELRAARAEIAGHVKAVDAARAITEDATGQVTALRGELLCARGQGSQAVAQRERATQLLQQEITATAKLKHELEDLTERLDDLVRPNTPVRCSVPRTWPCRMTKSANSLIEPSRSCIGFIPQSPRRWLSPATSSRIAATPGRGRRESCTRR